MFDLEFFDIKLDTEIIGRNFIYAEEVDSTNSVLLNKSNKFNDDGTVVLSEKQLQGRGRKDRVWYSNKEMNLTFSILLNDRDFSGGKINLVNFASSLAVAMAIENLHQLKIELKWPNDVLINSKKTAGILIESTSAGKKIEKVVTGIGINVNQTSFQGIYKIPPTSIKSETGSLVEREVLLAEVLNIFEEILHWIDNRPGEILKDWKARCRMIGEKISVTEGENVKYGIFDDIDDEGFLILKTGRRLEKIYFGDVSIG
ncbi:MAG TPA: biotin--[acetyl-CoA-carboxylase] ligase [Ignavibacteriaceae bacterium]|nr:biotin--[acetyl-CoA-carboxylase] ligase [Ignavibacteriaceae bacterium]